MQDELNNRDLQKILSYCRYFHLLSPLVFTVTSLEISLFQAAERQYPSFEKIQVSKMFQELAVHHQTSQLNDSLASPVCFKVTSPHEKQQTVFKFQVHISHPANNKKGVLNLTMQSQRLVVVPDNRHEKALSSLSFLRRKVKLTQTATGAPPILLSLNFYFSKLSPKSFLLVGILVYFTLFCVTY